MKQIVHVVVDSRLKVFLPGLDVTPKNWRLGGGLPPWYRSFLLDLKEISVHSNPEYHKKKSMGFSTWKVSSVIKMSRFIRGGVSIPRGCATKLRELAKVHEISLRWRDDRNPGSKYDFPEFYPVPKSPELEMRSYQTRAVEIAQKRQQGIIKAPTGSGKSVIGLSLIHALGLRAIIVVNQVALAKQWVDSIKELWGEDAVFQYGGHSRKFRERPITVAIQQTMYRNREKLEEIFPDVGVVIYDEVQNAAARTYQEVIDRIPAKYRIGLSADHTRKDGLDFLTTDVFGDVIYSISKEDVEADGFVHPVTIRVIPTDYEAAWYRDADTAQERNFTRLIEEMQDDEERNAMLLWLAEYIRGEGQVPSLYLTKRRAHAKWLHEAVEKSGPMLGSKEDEEAFDETLQALLTCKDPSSPVLFGMGTHQSLGVGLNIPNIRSAVCATPIGSNRQFFNQVMGRVCRSSKGKEAAYLYYLLDYRVFPKQLQNLVHWNRGMVEMYNWKTGKWVAGSLVVLQDVMRQR